MYETMDVLNIYNISNEPFTIIFLTIIISVEAYALLFR